MVIKEQGVVVIYLPYLLFFGFVYSDAPCNILIKTETFILLWQLKKTNSTCIAPISVFTLSMATYSIFTKTRNKVLDDISKKYQTFWILHCLGPVWRANALQGCMVFPLFWVFVFKHKNCTYLSLGTVLSLIQVFYWVLKKTMLKPLHHDCLKKIFLYIKSHSELKKRWSQTASFLERSYAACCLHVHRVICGHWRSARANTGSRSPPCTARCSVLTAPCCSSYRTRITT